MIMTLFGKQPFPQGHTFDAVDFALMIPGYYN